MGKTRGFGWLAAALILAACVVGRAGHPAEAQISIGPAVKADFNNFNPQNPSDITNVGREPAIGVNPFNPKDVLCGAIEVRTSSENRLGYCVSLDANSSWLVNDPLPVPTIQPPVLPYSIFDATIAPDPITGDLWYCAALAGTNPFVRNGVYIVRKPANSTSVDSAAWVDTCLTPGIPSCYAGQDKPQLAIGFYPNDQTRIVQYVAYGQKFSQRLAVKSSQSLPWYVYTNVPWAGEYFACPAVLADGTLLVAYRTQYDTGNGAIVCVRSADMGVTWSAPVNISPAPYVGNMVDDEVHTQVIPGGFGASSYPVLTVDPVRGWVYAVWCQRSGRGVAPFVDVDVYVAVSTNGGVSFSVLNSTSTALQLDGDQFMPWIAIDGRKGVNLIWYDTSRTLQNDDVSEAFLDARYARLTVDGTAGTPVITGALFAWLTDAPFHTLGLQGGAPIVGDYQGIAAAGCLVYPCYAMPSAPNGQMHYFVRTIKVCTSDFNSSGVVEDMDFATYLPALAAQEPRADLNGDGVADVQDLVVFLNDYNSGD
jgi:hypothetical protein